MDGKEQELRSAVPAVREALTRFRTVQPLMMTLIQFLANVAVVESVAATMMDAVCACVG
jgi:hypothetical protein